MGRAVKCAKSSIMGSAHLVWSPSTLPVPGTGDRSRAMINSIHSLIIFSTYKENSHPCEARPAHLSEDCL